LEEIPPKENRKSLIFPFLHRFIITP